MNGKARRKKHVPAKGVCPVPPHKQSFTAAKAEKALLEAKIANGLNGNERRKECRKYYCVHCELYHLTSRPQLGTS